MPPLVSIITVNFRQTQVTCELLESINNIDYPFLEVIVVDNGSIRDEAAVFQKYYPSVKVIVSEKNLGFAGGNNLGIQAATGEFFFLVNNDTEIKNGLIENLIKRFDTKKVGMVSPKICYFQTPDTIQYAGFTAINPLTGRNRAIGKGEKDHGQYDEAFRVPYGHGAAMMLHRSVVELVGLMPEAYFLYYEELDWCEQIRRAGYEIWYEPAALIFHKESITTGKESPLKVFYTTRNRILFMRRNFSAAKVAAFLTFFFTISFPVNIFRFLMARKFDLLKAFCLGAVLDKKPIVSA